MMEAVRASETSVDNHSTRQYNPEDSSEQPSSTLLCSVTAVLTSFLGGYMSLPAGELTAFQATC
jgi:hypothetical protein